MDKNFNSSNKIEKVVEENTLLILLDTRVIIKNKKEKIGIYLNQISNVRLIKNRDLSLSVAVLVNLFLVYILFLIPMNLAFPLNLLCITSMTIVFTASFFIKKYTYKLLINQGKFRFNEITISKFNCMHAENFALNFKNGKLTNKSTSETAFQQLKEAL